MSTAANEPPKGRLRQLRQAYRVTKQYDRFIGLVLLATFLLVGAVGFVVGWLLFHWIFGIVLGLMFGLLGALIVFGRRAEKAAYRQVEGQVGAAAGALNILKRGWSVKPAVGFTKSQDVVHRVVGKPGIVLVAEGNPNRVRNLLAVEKKKHARIAGDVTITEVVVGSGDGQVPLPKLVKHVRKLPKALPPAQMTPLLNKLKALDAMRPQAPVPKGPVPTSARGARKMMQGR
ncbi:DUF4191 domain-containing protein [Solicola sp. PLA-1-18]|uniref:DUF4191 domain-containing protein n=1 Tax=Solicola sp. PLA-1-18 TaxID=3380532 RepID=UPI003B77C8E0